MSNNIFIKYFIKNKKSENDSPLPAVSAKSWCLVNCKTEKIIAGKNENYPREIASLTKIMTCYVCI